MPPEADAAGAAGLRHAVLGAGGVGLSLAADLARAGRRVLLIMRQESLARYSGELRVSLASGGGHQAAVPAVPRLAQAVDVLWIAVKRPQLAAALRAVEPGAADAGPIVVPLLNGLDHLPLLEQQFGAERVVAGSVRVEAVRTGVGEVRRASLFTEIELAGQASGAGPSGTLEPLRRDLRAAGIRCVIGASPQAVLWRKLSLLAPVALATTAVGGTVEQVRADPETAELMHDCAREICAVAGALGVPLDPERRERALRAVPGRTTSSLQRDAATGNALELDAIGGAVLRAAVGVGLPAPATRALTAAAAASARHRIPTTARSGDE